MSGTVRLIGALQELYIDGWALSVDRPREGEELVDMAINEKKGLVVQFTDYEDFEQWVFQTQKELHDGLDEDMEDDLEGEDMEQELAPLTPFKADQDTNGEGFRVGRTGVTVYGSIPYTLTFLGVLEICKAKKEKNKDKLGVYSLFEDDLLEGYRYMLGNAMVIIEVPIRGGVQEIHLTYKGLSQLMHEVLKAIQ